LCWDETVPVELRPLTGPLSIPQMIHEWIWSSGGMILTGENRRTLRNPVPVPLCPPQIPHGLSWEWTRAAVVRSRRLTSWAMAGPLPLRTEQANGPHSCCLWWWYLFSKPDTFWGILNNHGPSFAWQTIWLLCLFQYNLENRQNKLCIQQVNTGTMLNEECSLIGEISGSHSGEYEDGCLLGCCAV
jgi:hypothetical protein